MHKKSNFVYAFLLMSVSLSISTGAFAEMPANDVESTRAALEKWVETRRIISGEKRDFELARQILTERTGLLQREIETLRAKIGEAETSITDADVKRAGLIEENEKLKEASSSLKDMVLELENRTKQLLAHLPDPIRERVKPLSQRFPENPDDTKLSMAERFQNVIGILNEVNKFNREITVTSEVRELPGGDSAEVAALYVGISQGYYVSGNGKVAGIGAATPEGWMWTPANHAASEIAQVISILKNESVATFVQLPVEIS